MIQCPNCGTGATDSTKFCRQCGWKMPQGEDAATWRLPPKTEPAPAPGTEPVGNTQTVEPPGTSPAYMPPGGFYEPAPAVPYQPEAAPPRGNIALGDWLSNGWRVYSENWSLMSVAAMIGGLLSLCSVGILAGPLLMGMYRMAFKTMRGERPQLADMFNFEGRFLQAFLAFLIYAAIQFGLPGGGKGGLFAMLSFVISPMMTMLLAFVLPLILERKVDVVQAVNQVFKLIFSREWLMWWIVGVVFAAIVTTSPILCGVGVLVAGPWVISSAAVAYRDVFGLDDPNRTMH